MRLLALVLLACFSLPAHAEVNNVWANRFSTTGPERGPPPGWTNFCKEYVHDCDPTPGPERVPLTERLWKDMLRINKEVNKKIKSLTDLEHWGVPERWNYGEDGYGDCDDYVLLKRKLLAEAGHPLSVLPITVGKTRWGETHAVLMVKTDQGDFILNNLTDAILPWNQTGLIYRMRQSSQNPNVWQLFSYEQLLTGAVDPR